LVHGDNFHPLLTYHITSDGIANPILTQGLNHRGGAILSDRISGGPGDKGSLPEDFVLTQGTASITAIGAIYKANGTGCPSHLRPIGNLTAKHGGKLLKGKVAIKGVLRTDDNGDFSPLQGNGDQPLGLLRLS
jgi:hypothetical protein